MRSGCPSPLGRGSRLSPSKLARPFVKADAGAQAIFSFFVQIEQVFHPGDERAASLRDAPLLLEPWFERVFLSPRRTVA